MQEYAPVEIGPPSIPNHGLAIAFDWCRCHVGPGLRGADTAGVLAALYMPRLALSLAYPSPL